VPDGSALGTQPPLPSEQPLTRRERREREAAAQAAAARESVSGAADASAPAPTAQSFRAPAFTAPALTASPSDEPDVDLEVETVSAAVAEQAASPSTAVIPVVTPDAAPAADEPGLEGMQAALAGAAPEASASEAPRRARRAAEASAHDRDAPRSRRTTRAVTEQAQPITPDPAGAPRRGRRVARAITAMGFAGALALATSVPALSLLTPADVQALAVASTVTAGDPGQRVVVDGDVIASPTVEREDYQHQTIEEYARAAGIRPEATFTNNPSGTIQWPFAVGVHIGDRFGYRNCAGCSSNHGGQDFNPGLGAEIQAIADGVVSNSTDSGGSLGVVIMIDHVIDGETITSVYAHMEYNSRRFEKGDVVKVGDVVGTTGSTGMSTGPHLHFEIRLGGINGTKTDPLIWLRENTN
jgi:murein DD-endopeptidase MepM/ murein hydrolase activator NlpD